jgi:predicted NBD/HSP70 family sugar kinase
MKHNKATRQQLKHHNRQLILRAIYEGIADNRAALAVATGLTKPTVSDIIADLMHQGYVADSGRGTSTSSGGKPPRLLHFVPDARHVVGVSVTTEKITGVLANLKNEFVVHHELALNELGRFVESICAVCNALIAQSDAPILAISIGLSGIIDAQKGVVIESKQLGLHDVDLVKQLKAFCDVPIHIANNIELATRAQMLYRSHNETDSLAMVFLRDSIEIGFTWGKTAYHHAGDISHLPFIKQHHPQLQYLRWQNIRALMDEKISLHPDSILHQASATYADLRWALFQQDLAAHETLSPIVDALAHLYAWMISILRPDEITLAGAMSQLDRFLLEQLETSLKQALPQYILANVKLTLTESDYLSLQGAVAQALHYELGIL